MASFFNQSEYSDIIIKFGEKEIKAHKVVLCKASPYFKQALRSDGYFEESGADILELHDDDEEAVEAMLKWIYSQDYNIATNNPHHKRINWKIHIPIIVVADKYDIKNLLEIAIDHLSRQVCRPSAQESLEVIVAIHKTHIPHPSLLKIVHQTASTHLRRLIVQPEFRAILLEEPDWDLQHLDRLVRSYGFVQDRKGWVTCVGCDKIAATYVDSKNPTMMHQCAYCTCKGPIKPYERR